MRKPRIDHARVARVVEFIETYLRVPEGRDVGKPFRLRSWQKDIIRTIYGTPTRRCILTMARKNGKTSLTAALLLVHLVGPEARRNAQIVSAAQSRDQAALIHKLAAKMIRMSPDLVSLVHVRDSAKEMICSLTGVEYKALSADAATAYGRSPAMAIFDELGQVRGPQSELFDSIETGQGAQAEPLSVIISTQAATDADLLSTLIDDARTGADPRTKLIEYAAPKGCDLLDERAWKAANPGLGDILSIEEFRGMAEKARRMPAFEARFANLHLNQRVAVNNAFLSADVWKLGAGAPDLSAFEDYPSFWGLDLSARLDLTALVGICRAPDGVLHVDARLFAPRDGVRDRADRDRAPYDVWARQGLLTLTEGRSVDYGAVALVIGEILQRGPVQSIAFDRWRIDDLKRELERVGIDAPLVPFGQGYKDMSPALDAFEVEALAGKLRHGGNPVLTWCAANAVVTTDPAGNRKLDKSKATGRIDGMVALTMACGILSKGVAGELPAPPSPWEVAGFSIGAI